MKYEFIEIFRSGEIEIGAVDFVDFDEYMEETDSSFIFSIDERYTILKKDCNTYKIHMIEGAHVLLFSSDFKINWNRVKNDYFHEHTPISQKITSKELKSFLNSLNNELELRQIKSGA